MERFALSCLSVALGVLMAMIQSTPLVIVPIFLVAAAIGTYFKRGE